MKKINEIIDKYKNNEQLYEIIKRFQPKKELSPEEETIIINRIKSEIANYYLQKYKFKTYVSYEIQDELLTKISQLCDLTLKTREDNGKIKIYPVKESDETKEFIYGNIIRQMVDYEIENNISIEETFNVYTSNFSNQLKEYKQKLMESDMEEYHGTIYYMIERSLYIISCIKNISTPTPTLEEVEKLMFKYREKYLDDRKDYEKEYDYSNVYDDFYNDYDLIESCYKKLIDVENVLLPTVVEKWKEYLTNPRDDSENYRYVMHCFSAGMVDPKLMEKACCSLYTPTLKNSMYGSSGLIYDIDVDSIDTMCTDDAGSWTITKREFIENGCQSRCQLTNPNGETIMYECPYNSKIVLPDAFEDECRDKISRGQFTYSEIYLNSNAKAIGVFYTSECDNIEEVRAYAERNNLPLIKLDNKSNMIGIR